MNTRVIEDYFNKKKDLSSFFLCVSVNSSVSHGYNWNR